MVLEGGYNKRVPPISAENALEDTIVPVSVGVSIVLMEVVSIDEVDHSIQLQFEVILTWKENRATYLNLKKNMALNKMTEEDIQRLWLPLIIYTNTDQKKTTRLGEYGNGEWSTTVTITREANFTRAGLDELDETEIFQGAENGLTMRQTYTHRFQCNYLLSRYPFDTQVCTIKMNVATLDLDTVKLIPKKLVMEQEEEMTIFHIIDRQLVYKNASQPQDGVFMYIVLKRKITSEMMTTYFPTIMLTAITFATPRATMTGRKNISEKNSLDMMLKKAFLSNYPILTNGFQVWNPLYGTSIIFYWAPRPFRFFADSTAVGVVGRFSYLDNPHRPMVVDRLLFLPVGSLFAPAVVLDGGEEDHLAEGDELAHDQPDVDHLDR